MDNKLFDLFNVKSNEELDKYIKDNPEDPNVIALLDAIEYMENESESKE